MRLKALHIIATIIAALTSFTALADDVTWTVKTPRNIYENDKFAVIYRLTNAQGSDLKVPPIDGCQLLYGPSKSTSQSYQVVNGKVSSSSVTEFTYTYQAGADGTYTIPPASIQASGKRLTTKATQFTIRPRADQDKPASQRPVDTFDPDTQEAGRQVKADDVFVRISLSRPTAYEQEAIACTIKLYTKYSIASFMPTRQPSFDGFLIEDIPLQPTLNEIETLGGQEYMTAILKRCIIYPQKSGKLTINSGNYDVTVVQYTNVNMGMFAVRQPQEKKIKVSSNSATLNITPLPEPKPDGFDGAVGTFKAQARLVGNTFRTGDAATLIYTVTGTGNIKYLHEPAIDFPTEFEQYSPQLNIQANVQGNDMTGQMTVEYSFVPQTTGTFTILPPAFVYFDPKEKRYIDIPLDQFNIKVAKGISTAASTANERQDILQKNTDIRHIHTNLNTDSVKPYTPLVYKTQYWIIWITLTLTLIGITIAMWQKARLNADTKTLRRTKAGKTAVKRIHHAMQILETNGPDNTFYSTLSEAIRGYVADKMSIPQSQLSHDTLVKTLTDQGYPTEAITTLADTLSQCEMAQYTPVAPSEAKHLAQQTLTAVETIENHKPSKK